MDILTEEDKAFLKKMEEQRKKHKEAQARYRANNKEKINKYNNEYQENIRSKKIDIQNRLLKSEPKPPEPIDTQEILKVPKVDKRTRRGKKQQQQTEIKPSYQTRKEPLELSTIDEYIRKADIINRLFNNQSLPQPVKAELKKLLNDNKNIDKSIILNEMKYINNVDETINILRQSYKNDNSFKSYINILAVITSHIDELNKVYQVYTKVGKMTNTKVQETREENQVEEEDQDKIINVGETEYNKNVNKLNNIDDILIYGLYILFPSRRLDYRNMKITTEQDINKINEINYLIMSNAPYRFVFNDYKTYKTYNKQVFEVPKILSDVINKYINMKGLKNGDYLFSLDRNKKEPIAQSNFSLKISKVFEKIYNIPISIRFLRISWASNLYKSNPSIKQIKELSEIMAHSPDESRKYNKIFKTN